MHAPRNAQTASLPDTTAAPASVPRAVPRTTALSLVVPSIVPQLPQQRTSLSTVHVVKPLMFAAQHAVPLGGEDRAAAAREERAEKDEAARQA